MDTIVLFITFASELRSRRKVAPLTASIIGLTRFISSKCLVFPPAAHIRAGELSCRVEAAHRCTVLNPEICYAQNGFALLKFEAATTDQIIRGEIYFGARDATIFSKHGSPRSGSQNGISFRSP